MKKKILAFLMASIAILTLAIGVSAKTPDNDITPYWVYMDSIDVDVNFSGTTGTATLLVGRIFQQTTKLEGTLTVYKQVGNSWVYVDSQDGESTRALSIEFTFNAESGVTYKAVADVTAYGASGDESDSASKIKTCP